MAGVAGCWRGLRRGPGRPGYTIREPPHHSHGRQSECEWCSPWPSETPKAPRHEEHGVDVRTGQVLVDPSARDGVCRVSYSRRRLRAGKRRKTTVGHCWCRAIARRQKRMINDDCWLALLAGTAGLAFGWLRDHLCCALLRRGWRRAALPSWQPWPTPLAARKLHHFTIGKINCRSASPCTGMSELPTSITPSPTCMFVKKDLSAQYTCICNCSASLHIVHGLTSSCCSAGPIERVCEIDWCK